MDYHKKSLIHLHIPKTAGITLQQILVLQYPSAQIRPFFRLEEYHVVREQPPEQKTQYKLFQGHMPFGLHKYLTQPCIYITQLRDPIDLALSSYFFFELSYRETVLKREVDRSIPTLDEFRGAQMRDMFDNMQTRFISGRLDAKFGECSREMLDLAKQHLDEFFIVGLVEQFDEWVTLLSTLFGWGAPFYSRANVTRWRLSPQQLPADLIEWLHENNQFDFELYAYAKTLFQRRIAEQGKGFSDRVQEFRRRNQTLGPFFSYLSRSKQKLSRFEFIGGRL